jgi:hypothetical protein
MDTDAAGLLFQLLTMLPRLKSQDDVDKRMYLFQPPTTGTPEEEGVVDGKDDDDEEDQNLQDKESDSSAESSDEEEAPKPVSKKQKTEPKIVRVFQYQQLRAHHRVMAHAWSAILKLALPLQDLKHALQTCSRRG